MQNKYRFLDGPDEWGKPQHLHQLWSERKEDYENLTGATTILEVLGKVLTWWASGLAVKQFSNIEDCKILTKIKNGKATKEEKEGVEKAVTEWLKTHKDVSVKEYIAICQDAYKAHSVKLDETADAGTDLHAELEEYVKACIKTDGRPALYLVKGPEDRVFKFSKWAVDNIKRFIWSEAHCYDEILFVGGISDLGVETMDGHFGILDFKSAKDAYFNHFVQDAIYSLLVEKNGLFKPNGEFVMKIDKPIETFFVVPFGAKEFKVVEYNNVNGLKEAARACIILYRQKSFFENR